MNKAILSWIGVFLLLASWLGPLPRQADHSFTAHMTLHMLVVAVATPMISVGLAGTKWDAVRYWPGLFRPVLASIVEMILVWLWHAPYLHHLARHTSLGFTCEQLSFALVGWWLWQAAFGEADNQPQSERRSAGVLALLLTSMHMTLLGALIALSPRILFRHAHDDEAATLADQHLGGAVMLVVGGMAYLIGGLTLVGQVIQYPFQSPGARLARKSQGRGES